MTADDGGCGPLHDVYTAARTGDPEAVETAWAEAEAALRVRDEALAAEVGDAVATGDPDAVREASAGALFAGYEPASLDGPAARGVGTLLWAFGYVASFVLFLGARTPKDVVERLRWAYRTVGVDIRDTETADGVERTTFRCPYRDLGAGRWGRRRACHDVLDRVDDGYVSFLARHRDLAYQRPRACTASGCCYSEVSERRR